MSKHDRRCNSGFTIVELLVVVVLIALLAVILFPVFARAREQARSTSCRTQLHQLGLALHLYARDHDGRFPPAPHDWAPLVGPYVNEIRTFRCPSDGSMGRGSSSVPPSAQQQMQGLHPSLVSPPARPFYASFQYRGGLTLNERGETPLAADWEFLHHRRANVLYLSGEVRSQGRVGWTPVSPGPRPSGGRTSRNYDETPFLSVDPELKRQKAKSKPGGESGMFE